jgi:protein-S-isoprenylcysteine O-methyltransferase Ste14
MHNDLPGYWFGPVTRLGQLGLAPPVRVGSDPTQKKQRLVGLGLALMPSHPIYFGSRVCLAKHTLMPILFILFLFVLIFGQTSLFVISENFKNICGPFLVYL